MKDWCQPSDTVTVKENSLMSQQGPYPDFHTMKRMTRRIATVIPLPLLEGANVVCCRVTLCNMSPVLIYAYFSGGRQSTVKFFKQGNIPQQ